MIGKPLDFPYGAIKDGTIIGHEHWANNSRTHEYLREMYREVLSHYDVLTVGETPHVTPYEGQLYSHEDRHELGMIFQFEHMGVDRGLINESKKPLDLVKFKTIMSGWQDGLYQKGWNSNYWSNHDQARAVSRFGDDGDYRLMSAKMLGTCLHMMSGTPYIYQGEEIGTTNTYYDSIDDYNDLMDHHYYDLLTTDYHLSAKEAIGLIQPFSRDNARVPINWSSEANGGFTSGKPWLKANPNYREINVEKALEDKNSIFYYYKDLVALRRDSEYSDLIVYGNYTLLDPKDPDVYAYIRSNQEKRLLVISNFTHKTLERAYGFTPKSLLISNYGRSQIGLDTIWLNPYEALVVEI